MIKTIINTPTIIYIITLPLLLVDVYKSDVTLSTYLHINSRYLVLVSIFLFCASRILFKHTLNGFLSKLNRYVIFPLSLGLGVFLTIYDYLTPPNFVFSLFQLQYTQLFLIATFSGIVMFLQQPDDWFKKYYPQIIFISTLVVFACAFIVSLFPFDVFIKLSHEDGFIENLQVVVLLLEAFWALRLSQTLYRHKKKMHAIIFGAVALLLVVVAGDEISWGQRIFQIETPKQIAEYNVQEEISIHNLSFFDRYVNLGYIVVGLYGAFAWVFQYIFSNLKKRPFFYYIPPWFCSAYYFFGFAYNFYVRTQMYHTIGVWSEFAELMLYAGIMFTMFYLVSLKDMTSSPPRQTVRGFRLFLPRTRTVRGCEYK